MRPYPQTCTTFQRGCVYAACEWKYIHHVASGCEDGWCDGRRAYVTRNFSLGRQSIRPSESLATSLSGGSPARLVHPSLRGSRGSRESRESRESRGSRGSRGTGRGQRRRREMEPMMGAIIGAPMGACLASPVVVETRSCFYFYSYYPPGDCPAYRSPWSSR